MEFKIDKSVSDVVKFISAIVIALHHYSQYVLCNNLSDNLFYRLFSAQGGFVGVAIFFFLSGYGLMESAKKKEMSFFFFLKKRLLHIYLPVLFVTILWMLVQTFILGHNRFDFPNCLYTLLWGVMMQYYGL